MFALLMFHLLNLSSSVHPRAFAFNGHFIYVFLYLSHSHYVCVSVCIKCPPVIVNRSTAISFKRYESVRVGSNLFVLFVYLCGAFEAINSFLWRLPFLHLSELPAQRKCKHWNAQMSFIFIYLLFNTQIFTVESTIFFFSVRTRCVNLIPNCMYIRKEKNGCCGKQHFSVGIFIRIVFIGVGIFLFILSALNCLNNTIYLPGTEHGLDNKNNSKMIFPAFLSTFKFLMFRLLFLVPVIHNPHDMFSPNFKILNYEHEIRMWRGIRSTSSEIIEFMLVYLWAYFILFLTCDSDGETYRINITVSFWT